MKTIARYLAAFAVLITFAFPAAAGAAPAHVMVADAKSDICSGIGAAGGTGGCAPSGTSINRVLTFAINTLSMIAGVAAVIMVILAGLKYITANGEAANISSAKTTLVYAIIGLIVVVISQALVKFVLKKAA
jgi:hypothetical protein